MEQSNKIFIMNVNLSNFQIIPPAEWKPVKQNFEDSNEKFAFNCQEIFGKNDNFLLNFPQHNFKDKTINEFKTMALARERKFEMNNGKLSNEDLERSILTNSVSKKNIYGSDIDLDILDDTNNVLNLNKINDLIRTYAREQNAKMPGIASPYAYVAAIASIFAWHVEDVHFSSISINLKGKPKIWYAIAPGDCEKFERLISASTKESHGGCTNPLRHKDIWFSPEFIMSHGINVTKVSII